MRGSLVRFPSDSRSLVLDSCPVMEWLKAREPSASRFDTMIAQGRAGTLRLYISTINLGEIYYNSFTVWGEIRAEKILTDFRTLPITIVHPTEEETLVAARIKGTYKIAYGDAFAAVLGLKIQSAVVSGNPDFVTLRDAGLVAVEWLGK